jgi:probable selenium-dependent hydroxylase accessory protein YqeC
VAELLGALGIGRGDVVALAGAGGKTTLLYRLATLARDAGLDVVVTATTHMGLLPEAVTGRVFVEAEGDQRDALEQALRAEGRVTLLGRRLRPDKIEGVSPARVDELAGCADLVLVEADGARGRSLKVPAPHEPVIPGSTTLVVVLAALDVLGAPLDEVRVHRVELVEAATGRRAGQELGEDDVRAALCFPDGYLSRIPSRARAGVFLNKVEDSPGRAAAARIARGLVPPYAFVAAGSARSGEVKVWP